MLKWATDSFNTGFTLAMHWTLHMLEYSWHITNVCTATRSSGVSFTTPFSCLQRKKNLSKIDCETCEAKRLALRGKFISMERQCLGSFVYSWENELGLCRAGTTCSLEHLLIHVTVNQAESAERKWGTFVHLGNLVTDLVYSPIKWSLIISAHTFMENHWCLPLERVPCEFTAALTWLLCILNTASQMNVASAMIRTDAANWAAVCSATKTNVQMLHLMEK